VSLTGPSTRERHDSALARCVTDGYAAVNSRARLDGGGRSGWDRRQGGSWDANVQLEGAEECA